MYFDRVVNIFSLLNYLFSTEFSHFSLFFCRFFFSSCASSTYGLLVLVCLPLSTHAVNGLKQKVEELVSMRKDKISRLLDFSTSLTGAVDVISSVTTTAFAEPIVSSSFFAGCEKRPSFLQAPILIVSEEGGGGVCLR